METLVYKIEDPKNAPRQIAAAAALLKAGEVVAIPTETVYGLAANALDPAAVKKIFEAKGRPQDNPLIVHIAEKEALYEIAAEVPEAALKLADAFWPGPLTVILPKKPCIPDAVSGGLSTVAVRMPSHPTARAIIRAAGVPLAAPSANLSGFPSPTTAGHVLDDMNGRVPMIVDGGPCGFGIESTVITLAGDKPRILRPGAVTPEQIRAAIGETQVDEAVLKPLKEGAAAASPGMKYRHYSPNAAVSVVPGDLKTFVSYVLRHREEADHCLCFEGEEAFLPLPAFTYGRADEPLSQTRRLFDALRELDEAGASRVFARAPVPEGIGLGVCNRLYRAAGFTFLTDPPENQGMILGICGASGAGKSTFCSLLAQKGAVIADADAAAREVMRAGSPVLEALCAAFGADILLPDGSLDRGKLSERAFRDQESTRKLNAVTHPAILRLLVRTAFDAFHAGKTAVIDAPLLFTAGLDRLCDLTAVVTAPEEVRRRRIAARDGLSDAAIDARFIAQRGEAEKAAAADIILRNYPPFTPEKECGRLTDTIEAYKKERNI